VTDVHASVGDQSCLTVDFLQNDRLGVSTADGDCLLSNIEVQMRCSAVRAKHDVYNSAYSRWMFASIFYSVADVFYVFNFMFFFTFHSVLLVRLSYV